VESQFLPTPAAATSDTAGLSRVVPQVLPNPAAATSDTTGLSRVEFQFLPSPRRCDLRYHRRPLFTQSLASVGFGLLWAETAESQI
jgi:hypothetical protein